MNELPLFKKKENANKEEVKESYPSFGSWQGHTTGFGEKFMRKLGFTGRLGKDGQGISQPIATKKRPEGLGLGANGFKEAATLKANREIAKIYNKNAGIKPQQEKKKTKDWWKDSEEDDSEENNVAEDDSEDVLSATDSEESTPRRRREKKIFKTVEQLLEEQQDEQSEESRSPVVFTDHTGKQVKARSMDAGFGLSRVDRSAIGFELVYNLELLTSHEESRILDFGRNRSHRDKIREERKELNDKLKEQNSIISTEIRDLESLMQDIQHFLEEDSVLRKEPFDVLQLMENLQFKYPAEYYRYKIFQLLPSLLKPAIMTSFAHWDPLSNAAKFVELTDDIRSIILMREDEDEESHLFSYDWLDNSTQKYYDENHFIVVSIFTETLLQRIYDRLITSFNVLDQVQLVNYQQLLSAARVIWDAPTLLESFIKPVIKRLLQSIQSWSSDAVRPVPFFTSLLRYQTLLPGYDSEVFPSLTTTLSSYMKSLTDLEEAKTIITELKPLFDMESPAARKSLFALENAVLPRLAHVLRALEINPGDQQHIDYFTSVMEWGSHIDMATFSALLEGEFFPKWLGVLYDWIHQSSANLQEIVIWIQGWQSLFPEDVMRESYVVKQFNRCWDIINDYLDGTNKIDPGQFARPISYLRVLQNRSVEEVNKRLYDKSQQEAQEEAAMNIRDALTMWGAKNNIELLQLENKQMDGNTLYRFGNILVFFQDNVTYARINGDTVTWEPRSMQELLKMNQEMENDPLDSHVCTNK